MSDTLAEISSLSVRYGKGSAAALDDISLSLKIGEILAVIGESGSGKSTLALALAGLLPRDAKLGGTIGWPGFPDRPVAGRDIGFVFQDPGNSLNPVLRIGEQVAEVLRRHLKIGWAKAYDMATQLLARVKIPDPEKALRAFPHQLSGGQRQRVAIATAIAAHPKLLIADEPTSALDTIVQAEITALLKELVRDEGMTLLFITHDMGLASTLADRIAVFRLGKLVEIGPTRSVLSAPSAPYTAELIASHLDLSTPPLIAGSFQ